MTKKRGLPHSMSSRSGPAGPARNPQSASLIGAAGSEGAIERPAGACSGSRLGDAHLHLRMQLRRRRRCRCLDPFALYTPSGVPRGQSAKGGVARNDKEWRRRPRLMSFRGPRKEGEESPERGPHRTSGSEDEENYGMMPAVRSSSFGFASRISANFFSRLQDLICFSRSIALRMSSVFSK